MLKKLIAALLAFVAATAFAAVDVNKADQATLESIKGIGPAISSKILDERKKGSFKDWNDLIERVKGVGEGNAAKFSSDGLTVNGSSFSGAAPMAKKDGAARPAAAKAKHEEIKTAAPAAAAATRKAQESKPVATAASAPMSKAETAAQRRAEKKAAKEAVAKQAADKPMAAASGAKK